MSAARIRRIRAYESALRRRGQVFRTLSVAFDAVWLGLLDRDTLALIDEGFFQRFKEDLDGRKVGFADDAWNASGLTGWEAAVVDAHFPSSGRVVVTAAGAGREVLALTERGFDPVGFEPNATLVGAGRRFLADRGLPDRLFPCSRDAFPPQAGRCAAVVVGWGSYPLIPGRERRIRFLQGARAAVPEGAALLLSFFTRSETDRLAVPAARLANAIRAVRGEERVEVGDALAPNFVHLFTRGEMERELRDGGFAMVAYEEQPYGHAVGVARPADG